MSKRKFYKTVITLEVLSEEPLEDVPLEYIVQQCDEGDFSGDWNITESQELTGKEMAQALVGQRSEPEFFNLDEDGNDLDAAEPGENP